MHFALVTKEIFHEASFQRNPHFSVLWMERGYFVIKQASFNGEVFAVHKSPALIETAVLENFKAW